MAKRDLLALKDLDDECYATLIKWRQDNGAAPISASALDKLMGYPRSTAKRSLERLVARGVVKRHGFSDWHVVEAPYVLELDAVLALQVFVPAVLDCVRRLELGDNGLVIARRLRNLVDGIKEKGLD